MELTFEEVREANAERQIHDCKDNLISNGTCSDGCCDRYACGICGATIIEEAAD